MILYLYNYIVFLWVEILYNIIVWYLFEKCLEHNLLLVYFIVNKSMQNGVDVYHNQYLYMHNDNISTICFYVSVNKFKPDLKYGSLEDKLTSKSNKPSDDYCSQDSNIRMGANFSRHSSKGLSGRRCQSISNICNSKDHFLDPSAREVDAAYKFCNSLPSPNGTAYNNNYEHKPLTKKTSLQHTVSVSSYSNIYSSFLYSPTLIRNTVNKLASLIDRRRPTTLKCTN